VIRKRAATKKNTTIMLMDENSAAARHLKESKIGIAGVGGDVSRIRKLIDEAAQGGTRYICIKIHDKVLRYSFILTEESIWIKFYTNSPGRVAVPALKVRAGTPLYDFFDVDIRRLGGDQ